MEESEQSGAGASWVLRGFPPWVEGDLEDMSAWQVFNAIVDVRSQERRVRDMLLTSQEGKSVKFGCSSTENSRLPTKVAVKVIGFRDGS